jgi:hypothetical protein
MERGIEAGIDVALMQASLLDSGYSAHKVECDFP